MPSDNSAGVKMLVRDKPLSEDEWIKLIEIRRGMISPFLDKITLQRLGDVKGYLTSERLESCLGRLHIYTFDSNLIESRGFFKPLDGVGFSDSPYTEVYRFYGLNRNNEWLYARVVYTSSGNNRRFTVTKIPNTNVLIKKTRLRPSTLWYDLGNFFGQAVKDRKALLESMEQIFLVMEVERSVETLLPC